jgi:soluble lytic murein transglycosylase-like protein
MDPRDATSHSPPGSKADPRAERGAKDRRKGEDRRGPLRASAGRRRADRRRAARAAGLFMAAVTLLPSLRTGGARVDEASQHRPAPPDPGAAPDVADEGSPFEGFIEEASALYGVSSDLVRAVIQTESGFDPKAVSRVGAKGLMQIMPRTARALGVKDPLDPRENIFGGVKYLSMLLEKYNGNVALALASYNAGPGNVRKHGGIPPFSETRGYVRKITGLLADASEVPDTAGQASGD